MKKRKAPKVPMNARTQEHCKNYPQYTAYFQQISDRFGEVIYLEPASGGSHRISFRPIGSKDFVTVNAGAPPADVRRAINGALSQSYSAGANSLVQRLVNKRPKFSAAAARAASAPEHRPGGRA
jgi:hypothetical protein